MIVMKNFAFLFILILLVIFIVINVNTNSQTQMRGTENNQSEISDGDVFTSDGTTLHWWRYERGTPTVTIVLHGGPDGYTQWMRENYGPAMADVLGTTIFYDRRGCGASQNEVRAEDMTFAKASQDLLAVYNAAVPEQLPVVLFGHSFGGTLSVHAAPIFGESLRGVILSSPFLDMEAEMRGRILVPDSCATKQILHTSNECVSEVADGWNENEQYLAASHLDKLSELKTPVFLVTGECDILANAAVVEAATEALPTLQKIVIPNGTHQAFFENIEMIIPELEKFYSF